MVDRDGGRAQRLRSLHTDTSITDGNNYNVYPGYDPTHGSRDVSQGDATTQDGQYYDDDPSDLMVSSSSSSGRGVGYIRGGPAINPSSVPPPLPLPPANAKISRRILSSNSHGIHTDEDDEEEGGHPIPTRSRKDHPFTPHNTPPSDRRVRFSEGEISDPPEKLQRTSRGRVPPPPRIGARVNTGTSQNSTQASSIVRAPSRTLVNTFYGDDRDESTDRREKPLSLDDELAATGNHALIAFKEATYRDLYKFVMLVVGFTEKDIDTYWNKSEGNVIPNATSHYDRRTPSQSQHPSDVAATGSLGSSRMGSRITTEDLGINSLSWNGRSKSAVPSTTSMGTKMDMDAYLKDDDEEDDEEDKKGKKPMEEGGGGKEEEKEKEKEKADVEYEDGDEDGNLTEGTVNALMKQLEGVQAKERNARYMRGEGRSSSHDDSDDEPPMRESQLFLLSLMQRRAITATDLQAMRALYPNDAHLFNRPNSNTSGTENLIQGALNSSNARSYIREKLISIYLTPVMQLGINSAISVVREVSGYSESAISAMDAIQNESEEVVTAFAQLVGVTAARNRSLVSVYNNNKLPSLERVLRELKKRFSNMVVTSKTRWILPVDDSKKRRQEQNPFNSKNAREYYSMAFRTGNPFLEHTNTVQYSYPAITYHI